jgi:GTP-binding protein EngB required for normal cell division
MTATLERDSENLRDYTRLKLAIAAQLRALREILHRRGNSARLQRCEEFMAKLAEDRFTLAVLGQFKRGKSSLMNAIIGRELLPTGVLPLTSAITVLKFGPSERLVVVREGMAFPETVPVTTLANYVTERGNPGNRKRVKTATLELPLPFLRRGLEFVDTPGVGSAIAANTATTYSFLPECDAALFVTSADTPLTSSELEFLRAIREHAHKIFFIVNKTDLLTDETERTQVLDFVARTLREEMGADVRIFPLSALRGLNARLAHDQQSYSESGLAEIEETLTTFLASEKAPVFLAAIVERALRLTEAETGEVALFKKARTFSPAELTKRLEVVRYKLSDCAAARRQVFEHLRQRVIDRTRDSLAPELHEVMEAERAKLSAYINRVLARAGWRPGAMVTGHCAKEFTRRFDTTIERWLKDKTELLASEADKFAREHWSRIQTNLNEVATVANKVFDLPLPPSMQNPPKWHFTFQLRSPSHDATRQIELPASFIFTPSLLVRPTLRRRLQSACEVLAGSREIDALESIAQSINDSIDRIAREVEELASEFDSRMMAAITGERPQRRGASQGMQPAEEMGWGDATLSALRTQLQALRRQVTFADLQEEGTTTVTIVPPIAIRQPSRKFVEKDFAKRTKSRGCPVCDELNALAFDFFSQWQYALATEEKAQICFANEGGFCSLHMWQLHALSSTSGGSAGLARLVDKASQLLAHPEDSAHSLLPDTNDCRVCRLLHDAEADSIRRFSEFLNSEPNRSSYSQSQGLCLRHLALATSGFPGHAQFLRTEAARRFQVLAEDMQNYALKRDAIRNALTNTDESDAFLRAVIHLAGSKNLCMPRPDDFEI